MERDRETKKKKDRGRERGGEANLCFMIWLRCAAYTHARAHPYTHTKAANSGNNVSRQAPGS